MRLCLYRICALKCFGHTFLEFVVFRTIGNHHSICQKPLTIRLCQQLCSTWGRGRYQAEARERKRGSKTRTLILPGGRF